MERGVIISSNDAETCRNVFHYVNFCLMKDMYEIVKESDKVVTF